MCDFMLLEPHEGLIVFCSLISVIVHMIVYWHVEINSIEGLDRESYHTSPAEGQNSCLKWETASPVTVHSLKITVAWSADSYSALRADTVLVALPSYLTLWLCRLSQRESTLGTDAPTPLRLTIVLWHRINTDSAVWTHQDCEHLAFCLKPAAKTEALSVYQILSMFTSLNSVPSTRETPGSISPLLASPHPAISAPSCPFFPRTALVMTETGLFGSRLTWRSSGFYLEFASFVSLELDLETVV